MNNPYFPAMQEVSDRLAEAHHLLLGIDFDGTLVPIVEDPVRVTVSSPLRQLLWTFAGRDDVSLVISSGRKLADLQEHVGVSGAIYVGNHGLEIIGPHLQFAESTAAARAASLHELAVKITRQLQQIPGVFVEDKGLTLSVHHRRVAAPEREEVWRIVLAAVTETNNLFSVITGNKVFEVRRTVSWHKGDALNWIREQIGVPETLLIYLAGERTDESVFRSLADGITIKVGESAETTANYLLAGPAEVEQLLDWVKELLLEKDRRALQVGDIGPAA